MKYDSKEKVELKRPKVNFIGSTISGLASCALVSATALFLSPSSASAVGIIDNFNSCTDNAGNLPPCFTGIAVASGTLTSTYTTTSLPADAVSTTRNVSLTVTENNPGDGADASLRTDRSPQDRLTLASGNGDANYTVTYSSLNVILATLGGSANDRFNFTITQSDADAGRPQTIGLILTQGSVNFSSSFTISSSVITNQSFFLPFSSFTGAGSFNPNSAVTQIALSASGTNAPDLSIDSLTVDAVPFEYSHELGLVGLAGLFGAYKLRSKRHSKIESEVVSIQIEK